MTENNSTCHKSSVALIITDVINHFEFPDGDKILKNAFPIADRLAKLKPRCRRAGIPAIYVHGNFGPWRSDAKSLVRSCLDGLATNRCIIWMAHDATMRNFSLYVPSDCSTARTRLEHEQAIEHSKEMTGVSVIASSSLRVSELRGESGSKQSKA